MKKKKIKPVLINNLVSIPEIKRLSYLVNRQRLLTLLILFIAFSITLLISFRFDLLMFRIHNQEYQVGQIAANNLIAPYSARYEDVEESENKRRQAELLAEPVFLENKTISENQLLLFRDFADLIRTAASLGNDESLNESINQLKNTNRLEIEQSVIDTVLGSDEFDQYLQIAEMALQQINSVGVVKLPDILSFRSNMVILENDSGQRQISFEELILLKQINPYIEQILQKQTLTNNALTIIKGLLRPFVMETYFYSQEKSREHQQSLVSEVAPIYKTINRGDIIIKKGFLINSHDMAIIEAINFSNQSIINSLILGNLSYLLFLLVVGYGVLLYWQQQRKLKNIHVNLVLCFSWFFLLFTIISNNIADYVGDIFPSTILPIAFFSILITILIDLPTAIISSLFFAFMPVIFSGYNTFSIIYLTLYGCCAATLVSRVEKRVTLLLVSPLLAMTGFFINFTLFLFNNESSLWLVRSTMAAAVSGFFSAIFALGILPIFEQMLNLITPLRLLELSDLNTPLFQKMLHDAPGTYAHSVNVAALAERGCREINANALLARVGAFYHDIGKLEQPQYFIENQNNVSNPHDSIKPTLSASILRSHLKLGVEKGKEIGLPSEIIDIIAQHHGNDLIRYFYRMSQSQQESGGASKEQFTYQSIPPESKEAAIVMLADTVDAACRTLKKPSKSKLQRYIWELIMEKTASHQLSNCGISFNELEIIKESFASFLTGQYHSRIVYPKAGETETAKNE